MMDEEKREAPESEPGTAAEPKTAAGSGTDTGTGTEALIQGMTGMVTAAMGVGAALAKATAEATARGKQVPAPPAGSFNPMNIMVHYSLAAIVNVMGAMADGIGEVRGAATESGFAPNVAPDVAPDVGPDVGSDVPPPTQPPQATAAPDSSLPTVHCGATLRIPLSVENPGQEAMAEMRFACLEVSGGEVSAGQLLGPEVFRFEPELLSVAPRDFEKLTVYVDVPETAAPGTYEAKIGPSPGDFEIVLRLNVIPAVAETA